jgi:hypothetical protein
VALIVVCGWGNSLFDCQDVIDAAKRLSNLAQGCRVARLPCAKLLNRFAVQTPTFRFFSDL